jgi:group I intron endonuclease
MSANIDSGVYTIRNLFDGKQYVGSAARSLKRRWKSHRQQLRSKSHHNYKLLTAWCRCGETAFEFDVIELGDYPLATSNKV